MTEQQQPTVKAAKSELSYQEPPVLKLAQLDNLEIKLPTDVNLAIIPVKNVLDLKSTTVINVTPQDS